jgi:hypothetical protein
MLFKKHDSSTNLVPMDYKMGELSVLKQDTLKVKPLNEAVSKSSRMLQRVIDFWKEYA